MLKLVNTTDLKSVPFKVIGSSPIESKERWLSGLRHWFAKPTYVSTVGSNPILSVGYRQVVTHRFLVATCEGSNPSTPTVIQAFYENFSLFIGILNLYNNIKDIIQTYIYYEF